MSEPEIAVVIPTRGREGRLAFALEALAGQTLARDRFEVIVARDGALPGPQAAAPEGLDVRFEQLGERLGAGPARNAALRLARAELIAFTDDDCRPAPDWLEQLLSAWRGMGCRDDVVLQGRTMPDPDESHLLFGRARSISVSAPAFYETCNIAYPRALLERLGGFDPDFTFGAEDTELGLRASEAGAELRFLPEATVVHAVHPGNLRRVVDDAFRYDSLPLLLRRHPQARRLAHRRIFWRRSHERFLLALAGLAVTPRSRLLGALAIAPWIWLRWDPSQLPGPRRVAGFAAGLPMEALADGIEVYSMLRASIRHRSLLL